MHKYNLGFISDENIYSHVKKTVESYERDALKNSVYEELTKEHCYLLSAIYLLAFSTYEGFEQLTSKK